MNGSKRRADRVVNDYRVMTMSSSIGKNGSLHYGAVMQVQLMERPKRSYETYC